jgi:hypothetical protein
VRNACLDAALDALKEAAISDYKITRGGKHLQIRWPANGGDRFYSVPCTPSDWRSPHNVRSDIRKMLRSDGLISAAAAEPEEPAPRPRTTEQRLARLEALVEELRADRK